jgi:hypothetical protein
VPLPGTATPAPTVGKHGRQYEWRNGGMETGIYTNRGMKIGIEKVIKGWKWE